MVFSPKRTSGLTFSVYFLVIILQIRCQELVWNVGAGVPLVAELPPLGHVMLKADNLSVSNSTSSVTCQVHTQIHNVTLSYAPNTSLDSAVTGRDVGVISLLLIDQTDSLWFLKSSHNFSINVVVVVTELTENNPLPGGCNIEFNLENDANLHLQYTDPLTVLSFQWASVGFGRGRRFSDDCLIKSDQNSLTYDVYVYYMRESDTTEDTYISAIQSMMDQQSVTQIAKKVVSLSYSDKSNLSVISHWGEGAIYTVVVSQAGHGSTLYFPVSTYSCSFNISRPDNCQQASKVDVVAVIFTTFAGIVGLFMCFLGHRFFKTEMFIFGFMAFALVTYIPLMMETDSTLAVQLGISATVGLLGGCLWLLLWWRAGIPVLSVLLGGLVAGFLFASVLFFTPLGSLNFWTNELNFGMVFTCAILILPILLLIFTRMLNILSCSFVGSFAAVLAADTYLHSHIKFIILNIFYRFSVPEYNNAKQIVSFKINEIILSVLWGLLFLSGTIFQYARERKRSPFPPCPYSRRRAHGVFHRHTQGDSDERRPLLREGPSPQRVISFPPSSSNNPDSRSQ